MDCLCAQSVGDFGKEPRIISSKRTLSWSRAIPARIEETDFVIEGMMGKCPDPYPKDRSQNNLVTTENYKTLNADRFC